MSKKWCKVEGESKQVFQRCLAELEPKIGRRLQTSSVAKFYLYQPLNKTLIKYSHLNLKTTLSNSTPKSNLCESIQFKKGYAHWILECILQLFILFSSMPTSTNLPIKPNKSILMALPTSKNLVCLFCLTC